MTLSITGVSLIVVLISAGIACALSLSKKTFHKIFESKSDKYKREYEKDQQ